MRLSISIFLLLSSAKVSLGFQKAFNIHNNNHYEAKKVAPTVKKFPLSYLFLTSSTQKCVFLESTQGTTISIDYSAPELQINPANASPLSHNQRFKDLAKRGIHAVQEKTRLHREMAERMNAGDRQAFHQWRSNTIADEDDYYYGGMRDRNHRYHSDKYSRNDGRGRDRDRDRRGRDDGRGKPSGPLSNLRMIVHDIYSRGDKVHRDTDQQSHKSFTLIEQESRIRYTLQNTDHVKICLVSNSATFENPMPVSFRVRELDDVHLEHDLDEIKEVDGLSDAEREKMKEDREKGKDHMKFMEREMVKLIQRVSSIEKSCVLSKETHVDFYEESVEMAKSIRWFSIGQLVILIGMGMLNFKYLIVILRRKGFVF